MIALFALAATAALNPLEFFSGPSHGRGTIKILFKSAQPLVVKSHGRPDGKGGIILDQKVQQGSEPIKTRQWVLRPTSPTTLTGTLSDASGPIVGKVNGRTLTLDYPMKGGLTAHQTLDLQPGDRVLLNHMTVTKFGLTVARIEETITKE